MRITTLIVGFYPGLRERFSPGRWPFLGPGSEKKWYSTHDSKPQGECDKVAELMMIKFGGKRVFTQFSEPQVHCPEERSEAMVVETINTLNCADEGTIETVFSHGCLCKSAQYLRSSLGFA